MTMTSVFAEITKTAPQDDGSVMVYGKATGSDLDLDGQRCDPIWLQTAMPEWFRTAGNVREQHNSHRAVGKAIDHEVKDDGHWIKAHIVDPVAVAKTKAGVFTGFSIGVKSPVVEKSDVAPNGLISGGSICEVSLVDRPALPTALFTMCKSAKPGMQIKASDFDAQRMLVRCEEFVEKTATSDMQKADMTVTLADTLDPEQVEELNAKFAANKAADVGEVPASALGTVKADTAFDADKVKALAEDILVKIDDGLGNDESGDISGAEQAIAIIAELIQSEAKDLATAPMQGCDIDLLMQAVHALCWFKKREEAEQGGLNPSLVGLAATPDATKAKYSAEQKRQMMKDGKAIPNAKGDPSFPIDDAEDLQNAISDVGRGGLPDATIRKHIIACAKRLGLSNKIPAAWTSSGSNGSSKSVEPEKEKTVEVDTVTDETVEKAESIEEVDATTPDVEKTAEPETTKAAVGSDGDALVKALSAVLEKADNPLRKMLEGIETATKSTVEALGDLSARLEKVESMPVPGGPALRRTEVETKSARKNDLLLEAARFEALAAANSGDLDLRKGYDAMAAQLKAQVKAL